MQAIDILLIIVLAALLGCAIRTCVKRKKHGSMCCGGSGSSGCSSCAGCSSCSSCSSCSACSHYSNHNASRSPKQKPHHP